MNIHIANEQYKHAQYLIFKINDMSITPLTPNFIPDSDLSLQKTGCNSHVKNTTIPEKIANTNTKL
jgi:hypothetical protein